MSPTTRYGSSEYRIKKCVPYRAGKEAEVEAVF